jgi:hypothetical protein
MGYEPATPRKVDRVTMDHVKEFFIGTVSLISHDVDTILPHFCRLHQIGCQRNDLQRPYSTRGRQHPQ